MDHRQALLRAIPKVDELLQQPGLAQLAAQMPASVLRDAVRAELDALRKAILSGESDTVPDPEAVCAAVCRRAKADDLPSLRPVINGTGVVLHTNLGRSCLSQRAIAAVVGAAEGYSTLEYDV